MIKILEKLKEKIENKIYKEMQQEIIEITKRPLEGELIKIDNIKIRDDFKQPKTYKIEQRRKYYQKYGYFKSQIVLNERNYLIDGYTTYLLARENGYRYITIIKGK